MEASELVSYVRRTEVPRVLIVRTPNPQDAS